jgi:tagatose 1,6-diphosphate aldolase
VVQEKERLARALAPHASAVLLDPVYGLGPIIRHGLIPRGVGLMAALEKSGYTEDAGGWHTSLIEGWTVAGIKRLGAAAVKLLLYYHPEAPNAAGQEAILGQVAADCRQQDLPLFVEPICFPLRPGQRKTDPEFAAGRAPGWEERTVMKFRPLHDRSASTGDRRRTLRAEGVATSLILLQLVVTTADDNYALAA